MSASDKEKGNELLETAMHRTDTSFTMFENEYWKSWLKHIRPTYEFPSPKVIGGVLLINEYTKVQVACCDKSASSG